MENGKFTGCKFNMAADEWMKCLDSHTQIDKTFHSSRQFVQNYSSPLTKNGTWNQLEKRRIERAVTKSPKKFSQFSCFFTRTERDFRDMAVGMHHGRGLQRLLSSSLCYNSATNCVACSSRDSSLWLTDGLPKCKQARIEMVKLKKQLKVVCCCSNLHGCSQTENTIALLSLNLSLCR